MVRVVPCAVSRQAYEEADRRAGARSEQPPGRLRIGSMAARKI
jgi:hypothetical protein